MTKITLDRETFKALASDTRLDILKTLDGKNMGLNEIAKVTNLNKATLHEHLMKLHEAGLIKRNEREGHKWVYYRLTWKGESLLHPENTKIVVLFAMTFMALWVGLVQLIWYIKGTVSDIGYDMYTMGDEVVLTSKGLVDSSGLLLSENGVSGGFVVPSGLPDFFQMFLMKAKLAYYQGIPLGRDLSVIENGSDSGVLSTTEGGRFVIDQSQGLIQLVYQDPVFLYAAVGCFVIFSVLLSVAVWRLWENRTPKL